MRLAASGNVPLSLFCDCVLLPYVWDMQVGGDDEADELLPGWAPLGALVGGYYSSAEAADGYTLAEIEQFTMQLQALHCRSAESMQ
eukprot:8020489-Pyramimonas_sp.AAC.2